ncbi:MAG: energy transducer TonB [Caulobacteraceae bacterium]|nr:energy transducer TonB [Caulobacteraceae bacterium]
MARFTDARNVVLSPIAPASPGMDGAANRPPPGLPTMVLDALHVEAPLVVESTPSSDPSSRFYGSLIQDDIKQALASNPQTSKGDYSAGLEFWISPSGQVQRASVVISSGNADRDTAILTVLAMLKLQEPPPRTLPQPVKIRIRSQPRR